MYPAGFLQVFQVLHGLTSKGADIALGQCIFCGIYVLTMALVHRIYFLGGVPQYLLVFLSLSKRMHSIYALRLFNDPVAMLFLYASLYTLLRKRTIIAVNLFSYARMHFSQRSSHWGRIACSVKMNILLFAPALALHLFATQTLASIALYTLSFVYIQVGCQCAELIR